MNKIYYLIGILIPLFGTTFGSSFVYLLKNNINNKIEKMMIGFAIGVMLCASIFSLLIPSIELSKYGCLEAVVGFILGFILLMSINVVESKIDKLMFSVTLHNIPEGLSVGVCFVSAYFGEISFISALLLSVGIALQNIPEGMIISFPLKLKGYSKSKSFYYGFLSGLVEPIASIITILFVKYIKTILPYFLSFASGCMIYVIIDELIFKINDKDKNYGIIGFLIGFIIMLILDISFG